jgi:hypothetical protein
VVSLMGFVMGLFYSNHATLCSVTGFVMGSVMEV